MEMVVFLAIIWLFSLQPTQALALNACSSNATILISFQELDPPQKIYISDPTYTMAVLTNGEPFSVNFDFDPQDKQRKYPFNEYFVHGYSQVSSTYVIRMIKGIDRDGTSVGIEDDVDFLQYRMSCQAVAGGATENKTVIIEIKDVNDNAPFFPVFSFEGIYINEFTPVGVTIFRGLIAQDLDAGTNRELSYQIENDLLIMPFNATDYFYISPDKGDELILKKIMNYTSLSADNMVAMVFMNIIAHDNAQPQSAQKSAALSFYIESVYGRDLNLEFLYPSCIRSIQPQYKRCVLPRYLSSVLSGETSEIYLDFLPYPSDPNNPGAKVDIIVDDSQRKLTDFNVTCSNPNTIPAGYESMFNVKTVKTGANEYKCLIIKVANKSLNLSDIKSLQIYLNAIEPRLTGELINIYVTVKERPPIIHMNGSVGYIFKNSSSGDYVLSDTVSRIPYRLTFQDPEATQSSPATLFNVSVEPKSPFTVDAQGYIFLTNSTLDYESVMQYTLVVTIWKTGSSQLSANATLTINVLDLKSTCSGNSSIYLTFLELDPPNVPDITESSESMRGGGLPASHSCEVEGYIFHDLPGETGISGFQKELNTPHPQDPSYTKALISNGKPYNISFDFDPQDKLRKYPFNEYFVHEYSASSNAYVIRMIKGMDRDGTSFGTEDDVDVLQYRMFCQAVAGEVVENRAIIIKIEDVNDNAPVFPTLPISGIYVDEFTPVGSTIFQGIVARDLDAGINKELIYRLESDSRVPLFNATDYFYISPDKSDELILIRQINYTSMRAVNNFPYFILDIIAHDNAIPQSTQKSTTFTFFVVPLNGSEPDVFFRYPSCIQSIQSPYKKCILSRYLTTVLSGETSEVNLDFLPNPADPNNPGAKVDIILDVSQKKTDDNFTATCILVFTLPVEYKSMFNVTTVKVGTNDYKCQLIKVANKSLNIADVRNLQIFLTASMNDVISSHSSKIYLTVKERSSPVISLNGSVGYIYVNSSGGEYVLSDTIRRIPYRLMFIDPDSTQSSPATLFNVSVEPGSPFVVDAQGYITLVKSTLNYESTRQYKLIVTVRRSDSQLSANTTLTINFLDPNRTCNSNSTIYIKFPELDPPNVPNITDPLFTEAVLTSGNPFNVYVDFAPQVKQRQYPFYEYFVHEYSPSTNSYVIRMIKGLDRDGISIGTEDDVDLLQYRMFCQAVAGGVTEVKMILVQIKDVNDNAPFFPTPVIGINLNELAPVGVILSRGIVALDLDAGVNRELTYQIDSIFPPQSLLNTTDYFKISPDKGDELVLIKVVNYTHLLTVTKNTYFNFNITVHDNAVPQSAQKSTAVGIIVNLYQGNIPNIDFLYPSCTQSIQPQYKKCILPRYLTSVFSGDTSEINLDFYPYPADPNNPGSKVDIIIDDSQKNATDNFEVTCTLAFTFPLGYESMFEGTTIKVGTNVYKYQIKKVANQSLNIADVKSLQIFLSTFEPRLQSDVALINLTVIGRSPPVITQNSSVGYIFVNSSDEDYVFTDSISMMPYRLIFIDPDNTRPPSPATQFNVSFEPKSPFTVDAQGYITLNNTVLETVRQYTLAVTIWKTGVSQLSANATVIINVLDPKSACNSNSSIYVTFPELDPPGVPDLNDLSYTKAVLTNGKPFNVTFDFDPQDKGKKYPFLKYFVHEYSPSSNTYVIRMIQGIDRDGTSIGTEDDVDFLQYRMFCQAEAGGAIAVKTVIIQIIDVNDNAPFFPSSISGIFISELAPVGVTVFRGFEAYDLDAGINGKLTYSLESNFKLQPRFNASDYFYISPDKGNELILTKLINYTEMTLAEKYAYFYINITAHDNAKPESAQKSASVSFIMFVTNGSAPNINFRYPSCIQSIQPERKKCIFPRYLTSVFSGDDSEVILDFYPDPADPNNPGAKVDIIVDDSQKRAEDNLTVACNLPDTMPAGYVSMFKMTTVRLGANSYKCQLTKVANKTLNISEIRNLQMFITAFETNLQVDFASINLTVKERSSPVISLNGSVGYIYENSSAGDYVLYDSIRKIPFRLMFIDTDVTSSSSATLFSVSVEPESPFFVDAQGYVTLMKSVLDYESVKQYTLIVTVWRTGNRQIFTNVTLTIHILDVNDHPPVITYPVNFIMSIPQGDCNCNFARTITTIQATDIDFGPPMFKLFRVIPPSASTMFTVDAGGAVGLHRPVKAGDVYALIVEVYDQGTPSLSTEVILVITVNSLTPPSSYKTDHCVIYVNEV